MKNYAIVVHGGAGKDSEFIRDHEQEYLRGLEHAANAGYAILEKGGSALDAVEAAVVYLEDHPLFNAGKGSALTETGEVEMCASIMDGESGRAGAAAIVKHIRNPIRLARVILENDEEIYLGCHGAKQYGEDHGLEVKPTAYFVTEHQYSELEKAKKKEGSLVEKVKLHGTVGAVAVDRDGNVAAATSTGGDVNTREHRIGDSSMIGVGTYANHTCAVSCTGDGELLIKAVMAHDLSANVEYRGLSVQEAAHYVIHEKNRQMEGDLGVIAVSPGGDIAVEFNCERMHRAWRKAGEEVVAKNYRE